MATNPNSKSNIYHIRVKGQLDQQWADWFEGMTISPNEDNTTLIIGPVIDDAALHGLLKKVRDAGLRLLSVNQIPNEATNKVNRENLDGIA